MSRATELVQRSAWQVVIPDAPQALGLAGGRVFIAGCEGTALAVDSGTGQTVGSQQVEGGLLGIAPSGDGSKAILAGPFGSWLWTIDGGDVVLVSAVQVPLGDMTGGDATIPADQIKALVYGSKAD